MGLFENDFDTDILRAIGHAKLHLAAGSGTESVITALAEAHLGLVTSAFAPMLVEMHEGKASAQVLKQHVREAKNPNFAKFLQALMAEGGRATLRLDELSVEILEDKKNKVRAYGAQVNTFMQGAAIIFLGTFAVVFLNVLEMVPENDIVPTIKLSPGFYAVLYAALGGGLGACFLGMKYRG